jgi:hypothetical protein
MVSTEDEDETDDSLDVGFATADLSFCLNKLDWRPILQS